MNVTSVDDILTELDRTEVTVLLEMADGVDLRPVQAVMVERCGDCRLEKGARLLFLHPASTPEAPACPALIRTLRPFVTAAAMGIPSEDPEGYLVTCPGPKGTVWRVSALG